MAWVSKEDKQLLDRLRDRYDSDSDLGKEADELVKQVERRHSRELKRLKAAHQEDLEDIREERRVEVKKAKQANAEKIEDLNQELGRVKAINETLEKAVRSEAELKAKELALAALETELKEREKVHDKEVAAHEKNVEKERKALDAERDRIEKIVRGKEGADYKQGYADGLSDGLREGDKRGDKAVDRSMTLAEKAVDKSLSREAPTPQILTVAAAGGNSSQKQK